jgi:hypothetical protein
MVKRKKPAAIKILFIGNSFTQRNDLPGLIAAMAAERDLVVHSKLISSGGASLRTHWNAGLATKEIATGHYNYVVLQEQSTLPVKNPTRMSDNVRLFDEIIKEAAARTVLYMTWAREYAPETQQAITDAYNSVGKELGAILVPVGLVWQRFLAKHHEPSLYDRDQSHPSFAGSYLAACVFVAALLKVDPRGIETGATRLDETAKKALQRAASHIN